MFEDIDFKSGEIRFSSENINDEDILQVEYPDNYILDLGWYGKSGGFALYIIRDFEWSVPVVEYHFYDETLINEILSLGIARIEKEMACSKSHYGQLWKTEKIVI